MKNKTTSSDSSKYQITKITFSTYSTILKKSIRIAKILIMSIFLINI